MRVLWLYGAYTASGGVLGFRAVLWGGVGRFGTSESGSEPVMVMGGLLNFSLPLIYAEKF